MLRYELTAMDVATCRFGISPLTEMSLSLRGLRAPNTYASAVAETYLSLPESRRFRDVLLGLVNDECSTPDVLNPRPESPSPRLSDELRAMSWADGGVLAQDLRGLWPGSLPRGLHGDARVVLGRVIEALEAYWSAAFAKFWARYRSILDADVRYRGLQCAGLGSLHALSGLHPSITVETGAVCARNRLDPSYRSPVRGRCIVFVPSLFTLAASYPATGKLPPLVIYPARGQRRDLPKHAAAGAGELLGETRLAILTALVEPRTTTQLAALLEKTPSAASQHLHALKRAALVEGARTGRSVLYALTPVGRALLAGGGGVDEWLGSAGAGDHHGPTVMHDPTD